MISIFVIPLVSNLWAGNYSGGTGEPNSPYLIADANDMNEIGIKKEGKMSYELADGAVKEYPYGLVGCEPVLGVTALESVGIVVDSTTKTLKRLPAVPLK